MFLDLNSVVDYDKEITPFLKNGVIIDTTVLWEIIEGLISVRISKRPHTEYEKILRFLDKIKIGNKWDKFFITPHILTEVAHRLRDTYRLRGDYKNIVKEIMPILEVFGEFNASKDDFIKSIDFKNPVIEAGDISIFIVADDFWGRKEKLAIFSNDNDLNKKYQDNTRIMVFDYRSAILNAL